MYISSTQLKVEAHRAMDADLRMQIYTPDVVVVDQLEETVRGAGGFGSTGGFGGTLPSINGVTGAAPQPPIHPQ